MSNPLKKPTINQEKYTTNKKGIITHKICTQCNESKILDSYCASKNNKTDGRNPVCRKCKSEKRKAANYQPKQTGTKCCSGCKETLDVSKFNKDKSSNDGLQSSCKKCQLKRLYKKSSTFDGFMYKLFQDIKGNTKKKAKDIDIQITIQDIKDIYTTQNGKCAMTGMKMTYTVLHDDKSDEHIKNKWNISIDRIDSDKGYTTDNIQLVCATINRMKMDLGNDEFLFLCDKLATNNADLVESATKSKKYKNHPAVI